jgi:hypothetical protein
MHPGVILLSRRRGKAILRAWGLGRAARTKIRDIVMAKVDNNPPGCILGEMMVNNG